MGYKMPNVVKEIYLPINPDDGLGLTIEQYKEKYGIDLRELFEFNTTEFSVYFNQIAKLYIVTSDTTRGSDFSSLVNLKVIPVIYIEHTTSGDDTESRIGVYDFQESGIVGIAIRWNRVNNKITIGPAIF